MSPATLGFYLIEYGESMRFNFVIRRIEPVFSIFWKIEALPNASHASLVTFSEVYYTFNFSRNVLFVT